MGYLLQKAEREGNFKKYRKYLFLRVFFDIAIIIAIIWSFYYTGSYYADAIDQCTRICPCINVSKSHIPVMGAWTGEEANLSFQNMSDFYG